jgi:hypothetical protein
MALPTPISNPPVGQVAVSAFTIPTSSLEADGTLAWDKTTLVTVQATAGGVTSLAYGYADVSTAKLIDSLLRPIALHKSALGVNEVWVAMVQAIRNLGRPGVCSDRPSPPSIIRFGISRRAF